jgi:phosphoribosylaminoimidazole-succinocarboxamide synthase
MVFVLVGYSGKAKNIEFIEDGKVRIIFRDSISAFDGVKLEELDNKGVINCKITTR